MMAYILSLVSMTILFFVNRSHHSSAASQGMGDNPLTSHILDTGIGRPAVGVPSILYRFHEGVWTQIASRLTDDDGRLAGLLSDKEFTPGLYKFKFNTKDYFTRSNTKTFYPYIEVVFEIEKPEQHYHVPILLSPFGFTTYRGS